MFRCYVCGQAVNQLAQFRAHLFRHSWSAELKQPILCRQGVCKATFSTVSNFLRHARIFHAIDEGSTESCGVSATSPAFRESQRNSCDGNIADDCDFSSDDQVENASLNKFVVDVSQSCASDVRSEAVRLVASLRANSSIPYSTIPYVIQSFNHMAESLFNCVQNIADCCICESAIDQDTATSVRQSIHNRLESFKNPLAFLSSVYKQDSYFESRELFVKPESVSFGSRYESHGGTSKLVSNSFQYISVQKTLYSLLQNKAYVEAFDDKQVPGVFQNFVDGEIASQHVLFSRGDRGSLGHGD